MAKQPRTPQQDAQAALLAEERARLVAEALEKLRNQLDPTREATLKLAAAQKQAADAAKQAADAEKKRATEQAAAAQKTAGTVQSVFGAFQSIASLGGTPTGAVAAFGGQLGKLAGTLGPWGVAAGAVISSVAQIPQLFKSAADSVNTYVAAFSPAASGRYTAAWRDMTAVIGEQLMPVLDAATAVVRYFGDTLGGLTGFIRPLISGVLDSLKPTFAALGSIFRDVIQIGVLLFQAFQPLGVLLFQISNGPLLLFVSMLQKFATVLTNVTRQILLFFGVDMKALEAASLGKAFVSTGTTSTGGFLQAQREKSFGLGPSTKDLPQIQVDILARILAEIAKFSPEAIAKTIAKEMEVVFRAVALEIVKRIDNLPNGIGQAVKNALPRIF